MLLDESFEKAAYVVSYFSVMLDGKAKVGLSKSSTGHEVCKALLKCGCFTFTLR